MSFIKFVYCRQYAVVRRHLASSPGFGQPVLQTLYRLNKPTVNLPCSCTNFSPTRSYSASAKPHITPALRKWKKKKRKSKAQQQKELDNLQKDLVKLLTKRAFQLVKDKYLLGGHREVVTTHAFTNFAHKGDHERDFTGTNSGDAFTLQSLNLRQQSDLIAKTMDASFPHIPSTAYNLSIPGKAQNSERLNITKIVKNKDLKESSTFSQVKFSDLFHDSTEQRTTKAVTSERDSSGFLSDIENFKLELESITKLYATSSTSPIHSWAEDLDIEMESVNEISTKTEKTGETIDHQFLKPGSTHSSEKKIKVSSPHDIIPQQNNDIHMPEIPHCNTAFSEKAQICFEEETALEQLFPDSDSMHGSDSLVNPVTSFTTELDLETLGNKIRHPNAKRSKTGRKEEKHTKGKSHVNVNKELLELNDKSFFEASCFSGCELLAVRNLQYQAMKHNVTSVDVFNRLIRTLAKKKDLQTIKSLFSLLRQQELTPTLQTYAGCLECIGRMSDADTQLCERLLADIKRSELDIGEIINTCSFESDEWDYVLQAIRMVEPEFVPNPPTLSTKYENVLVAPLNTPNEQAVETNPYALNTSKEEIMERAKRQLDMEKRGEIVVESISCSKAKPSEKKLQKMQNKVLEEWNTILLESFKQKLAVNEKKAQDNVSMTLYPYLKLFPPEEYVKIVFKCLRDLFSTSEGYSLTQLGIQSQLGHAVNRKYNTETRIASGMDKKMFKLYDLYIDDYLKKDTTLDNHRLMWIRAMSQKYDTVNMDMSLKKWPGHINREIGKFLLDMILYDLKIDANLLRPKSSPRLVTAFCTIYRPDLSYYTASEIKLHPVVTKLFKVSNTEAFTFDPSIVPMIVPPVPWISRGMGSLLLGSKALVRMDSGSHHLDTMKNVKETHYPAVLDSLNTLSACAWIINKPILDIQIDMFNNKGNSKLKVSPPASELPPLPDIKQDMSVQEKAVLYRERLQLQKQKQDMHGLWCTDLYRLSIANKFRDEVFWFPHSMDFRGRTYPLPPHFNHLGSDNVRGMLLFAKGKPLGKDGYKWLKIHLINLTGLKKRSSNEERLMHAETLMSEILDSADRPLTGKKWWQKSDEPWQTLACCMEIAKIERLEGNKEDYICSFPVHQDGSCNGLQHYAAIARDQAGAESVNLHPFDVPQDVYSDVVDLVEKARRKDAEEGKEIAQVLEGFVKRKVIKQTIMTTVYGVTPYGAKAQIFRQLKDISGFPSNHAQNASLYLTETTLNSLREMFNATKDIQDWLTESARLISAFAPVDWVTPLGFPILQPYFKGVRMAQNKRDKFKPYVVKQKNAFPPNYIHSLDSTHMMLTSLFCMHAGITFVSVHDCYWTHACDVPMMNKICREQFVNMHKQPLLEDLSAHLVELVKRAAQDPSLKEEMKKVKVQALLNLLTDVPKRGTFDLDNVLKSTYFFS